MQKFFTIFDKLFINGICISLNNDLNNSSDFLSNVGGSLPVIIDNIWGICS